jgi:hypothetical protein
MLMRKLRAYSLRFPTLAAVLLLSGAPALNARPKQPSYRPIETIAQIVGDFSLALRRDTQTLAHLSPTAESGFDFVPGAREAERQADGFVHIGDLHLRLRNSGGEWQDFASAHARQPIRSLPATAGALAGADITASMGPGIPLRVERYWMNDNGVLVLRFTLINTSSTPVEIGGLGMPMVFDNIISDRTLEQAHAQASFVDPYIGRDAGYLQVTRLNGKGPALLVLPEKGTPLEAYRPILQPREAPPGDLFTDRSPRGQTSEGFYDWTVASKGFADKEWRGAGEQWNQPTSIALAPGVSRSFGVRFVLAPSIRKIEQTLIAQQRPVAVGIPGYVVPTDLDATLYLRTPSPVTKIQCDPEGAVTATAAGDINGWARYAICGKTWGRARLSIAYADGSVQTVSYFVTKPLGEAMADLGKFSTTKQWFDDPDDPFGRSPAILTYDRENERIVAQEPRVWIAGMSDEGGAGSWVAAIAKQLDNPDPDEVRKLERLVDETVVGKLQVAVGPRAGAVRKSLFYYDPTKYSGYYDPHQSWKTWTSRSSRAADDRAARHHHDGRTAPR